MDMIQANLTVLGFAVVPVPCGHTVLMPPTMVKRAYEAKYTCAVDGACYMLAAIPDEALAVIGCYWRNPAETILVILTS